MSNIEVQIEQCKNDIAKLNENLKALEAQKKVKITPYNGMKIRTAGDFHYILFSNPSNNWTIAWVASRLTNPYVVYQDGYSQAEVENYLSAGVWIKE